MIAGAAKLNLDTLSLQTRAVRSMLDLDRKAARDLFLEINQPVVERTCDHPLVPDVPTFEESGFKGFDGVQWYGIVGPANLPLGITKSLNADINKAMQVPEVRQRLESVGTQLAERSAAEFEAYMKAEVAKYAGSGGDDAACNLNVSL